MFLFLPWEYSRKQRNLWLIQPRTSFAKATPNYLTPHHHAWQWVWRCFGWFCQTYRWVFMQKNYTLVSKRGGLFQCFSTHLQQLQSIGIKQGVLTFAHDCISCDFTRIRRSWCGTSAVPPERLVHRLKSTRVSCISWFPCNWILLCRNDIFINQTSNYYVV